ncbi:MAG: hypothetical protein IJW46_00035, partial [Clostridia bacterium]|nr:hypothetical protein [Clostridia bacterium]
DFHPRLFVVSIFASFEAFFFSFALLSVLLLDINVRLTQIFAFEPAPSFCYSFSRPTRILRERPYTAYEVIYGVLSIYEKTSDAARCVCDP